MSVDREHSDATRYAVAGWLAAGVAVALLAAAAAAFLHQRGRSEATDVTAAEASVATEPVSSARATAVGTESPTVSASPASATPTSTVAPTLSPTASPSPSASPMPTPNPTPPPPTIELRPDSAGVGETFSIVVHAPDASSATVMFLGSAYPLGREAEGRWFGVIGVPLWATLGPAELSLVLRDGFGAVIEEHSQLVEVTWVERPVDYLTLTEEQSSILTPEASAREREIRAAQFTTFDRGRRWAGLFRMPVEGYATTEFGQGRSINGGPVGGQHSGADIANEEGTLIHAAAAGRVSWAGEMPIRGNSVLIDHGGGVITGYHHLAEILVAVDDEVTVETAIGAMGSTGLSTGPHLHWELTIYGVNVDPKTWTVVDFTP